MRTNDRPGLLGIAEKELVWAGVSPSCNLVTCAPLRLRTETMSAVEKDRENGFNMSRRAGE